MSGDSMEEGVIKEEKEYYKFDEDEKIPISKEEAKKMEKNFEEDDIDPFSFPPYGYEKYVIIRLPKSLLGNIIGVLKYDLVLNEFALEKGYHPASGYKKCPTHKSNVKWRKKQIKLLGGNTDRLPNPQEGLYRERCEDCRQTDEDDNNSNECPNCGEESDEYKFASRSYLCMNGDCRVGIFFVEGDEDV